MEPGQPVLTGTYNWQSGSEYDNAIVKFFNKWPEFDYDREAEVITEFKRLCREKQWDQEERRDVKDDLRDALVERFNEIYGTNENDLEAWKKLCKDVQVDPVPNTLDECKKVRIPQISTIKSSHSNSMFCRPLTKRTSIL